MKQHSKGGSICSWGKILIIGLVMIGCFVMGHTKHVFFSPKGRITIIDNGIMTVTVDHKNFDDDQFRNDIDLLMSTFLNQLKRISLLPSTERTKAWQELSRVLNQAEDSWQKKKQQLKGKSVAQREKKELSVGAKEDVGFLAGWYMEAD